MTTIDEHTMRAPPRICFQVAADIERWPGILPHYRHVRFLERTGFGRGRVEMAAWRDFRAPGGRVRWPTRWVSDMRAEPDGLVIHYRHVRGITRGMVVRWEFRPADRDLTHVRILHEWSGPGWPIVGGAAASLVIGPVFVSAIARQTLAGVAAEAERIAGAAARPGPDLPPLATDAPPPAERAHP